jgi:hypothetical protein
MKPGYDRFISGVFTCMACGKRTRKTTSSDELCGWCYETESLYNEVVDGETSYADFLVEVKKLEKKHKRVWTPDRDWAHKADK